jgi:omega-hydroxy-beta-dihydromenaquinone-9 sulfotransferase
MESVFGRLSLSYRVIRRTFGVRVLPLFAGMYWATLRFWVWVGMAIDPLVSGRLRRTEVKRPIVLVGNPRTGTTFLQRFMCDQGYGAGMEVYRMLFPSLVIQVVLKPFLPLLEAIAPTRWHKTKAHDTSLVSVETDDVAVLFRHFDGFFLYGFFLAFDEEDHEQAFTPEVRDTSARDFDWLEQLWRRSLVAHDHDVVIAKLFSLGTRLPQFLERFPEARILYMARDPLSTIPSGMSLVTGVLDKAFGFWALPPEVRTRWFERLYSGLVELQRRFEDDYTSGRIPKDRVFIVRYDRMMSDFDGLMDDMHTFLGHAPTEAQRKAIAEQAEVQRAYKSEHKYDLAKFELDEARIRKDSKAFYDTFLPALSDEAAASARPSPAATAEGSA